MMLSRILISGLFAGALSGLIAGLLQWQFVQPVLLHAELYETGLLTHNSHSSTDVALQRLSFVRDGLSLLFSMLLYTGYALILITAMSVRLQKNTSKQGTNITARSGIIWGIAGYVAVQLAPAFSLPPEVPGVAGADLEFRQAWWFGTVLASAAGLWLISFSSGITRILIGVALLLTPHLIGAPQPSFFTGPAPTELGALFASRALGIGLASWAVLGFFAAYFFHKEGQ